MSCSLVGKNFGAELDILVLSAADFGKNLFYLNDLEIESTIELFKINVLSNIFLIKSLINKMGNFKIGKLIFISTGNASINGNSSNEMLGYKFTKTCMNQIMRTLAQELINKNIISVCVNPGWVRTNMGGINATTSVEEASYNFYQFSNKLEIKHNGLFFKSRF